LKRNSQAGFSLLELLIVVATIAVLMAIAIPSFKDALLRANTTSLSADARAIYVAVEQYYIDNNSYPATADFALGNLDPLSSMNYYTGNVQTRLAAGQADGYLGTGDEFWLEMTLAFDPSIRFLVANSQNAPMAGGTFHDGAFLYVDGILRDIGSRN
jgi:prepilin-type N-terminal cleavage/methylation domain-containing protein